MANNAAKMPICMLILVYTIVTAKYEGNTYIECMHSTFLT